MKEFEKALLEARPPELQVEEFRRALRHDLMREERRRRDRRAGLALGGLATVAAALASVLLLFVLRPSLAQRAHAWIVEEAAARPAAIVRGDPAGDEALPAGLPPEDLAGLPGRVGAGASADRRWLNGLYESQLDASRVKSLEEERLFALRRFRLTSGRSIVVLTEIGGDPLEEPTTELWAAQEF